MTVTASSRIAGWTLFLASVAVIGYGLGQSRILTQSLWQPGGLRRFALLCAAYAIFSAVLFFVRPRALGPALAAGVLFCAIQAVGPAPVAAVVFLAASAAAIGRLLLSPPRGSFLLPLLAGAALISVAAGIAVHFPINYRWVYAAALAAPLPFEASMLRRNAVRAWRALTTPALRSPSTFAAYAALGFVLAADAVTVLKPETGYDALAVHLMAPAYVAVHGRWIFDPQQYAWSVMPMGADWLYTAVYLLGGEFAARLANFGALLCIAAAFHALARRVASSATVAVAAALFVSMPLSELVTGSLFIENILVATILGAVLAIDGLRRTGRSAYLFAAGLLLGVSLWMKLGAVSCAVPLAIFAAAAARRIPLRHIAIATVVFLAIGSAAYLYAWQAAGSPVYPFVGGLFRSPYPAQLPPPPDSLYRMTFRSHEYLEAADGAFGFQWLLFAPAVLLVFARRIPFAIRAAGVTAAISAVAVACAQPYLRYLYPAAALFSLVICAAPAAAAAISRTLARAIVGAAGSCILLNLYFLPASGWYQANLALPPPLGFGNANAAAYLRAVAPTRGIIDYLNRNRRGEPVWFIGTNEIAGLAGRAYSSGWHQPVFRAQVTEAHSAAEVLALARSLGLRNFVAPGLAAVEPPPVREFLERYATREYENGALTLFRIRDGMLD